MRKPFSFREFVARCRVLLRHSETRVAQTPKNYLQFRDLVLIPEECRVLLNGKELTLTPKEYLLLEFLMQHPRQVLSRNQLLSRIWGGDFCGEPKTVDVHIRWLRQKIEEDPAHPAHITTVRGFGYRLGYVILPIFYLVLTFIDRLTIKIIVTKDTKQGLV